MTRMGGYPAEQAQNWDPTDTDIKSSAFGTDYLTDYILPGNEFARGVAIRMFRNGESATITRLGRIPVMHTAPPCRPPPIPEEQSMSNKTGGPGRPRPVYPPEDGVSDTASNATSQIGLAAGAFRGLNIDGGKSGRRVHWDPSIRSDNHDTACFPEIPNQTPSTQRNPYGTPQGWCPRIVHSPPLLQSNADVQPDHTTQPDPYGTPQDWCPRIVHSPPPRCDAEVRPDYTTQPNGSDPTAYLMQDTNTGNQILVDVHGQILSFWRAAEKENHAGEHPVVPPVNPPFQETGTSGQYGNPTTGQCDDGAHAHTMPYSHAHPGVSFQQPSVPSYSAEPSYSNAHAPSYNMRPCLDDVYIPAQPQAIISYFNSLCGIISLHSEKRDWIHKNLDDSRDRNNALDEVIFQMNDFLNPTRLRDAAGEYVFWYITEEPNAVQRIPTMTSLKEWHDEIHRCRQYLRRFNALAYGYVLNKGKVNAAWHKMIEYCDNWANAMLSTYDDETWENVPENKMAMNYYNWFSREMRRKVKTLEKDLNTIARLENMTNGFRQSVFKAEYKLELIMERFFA
ncbi:hypothetical protein ABW21_db0203636 [Orbilia brochopaga]|nr:hypothetical protein ABW21_db0203636 [Drechslerella brochopaga]